MIVNAVTGISLKAVNCGFIPDRVCELSGVLREEA